MFSPKFIVNANEASKNVDVINENFRNIKVDLEYLNDLDKRISDIDARTKCVNPERIRRDYLLTKSELDGKLYGSISDGRIPQKDPINENELKDTSWEAYYDHLQPVSDNVSDLGQSSKRVKTAYAYVVNALTGIYRAGLELASVFAPIGHASNSTTFGIADASKYGHVKSSTTNPLMDGVADPGTAGALVANYNHRHPTDTTREAVWGRTIITASSKFNDYVSPGVHKVSNAAEATDFPPGAYGYGSLAVFVYGAGDLVQVYFPHRSGGVSNAGIRMRVCYGGSWQVWVIINDTYYLSTLFAGKDAVNAFSQMNTFEDRVLHEAPPEYPVTNSAVTTGNLTWNNDTTEILSLTVALTGSLQINITNPREGRVTYLKYQQGSTKRIVSFSATGVSFWTPGSTSPTTDALIVSSSDIAGQLTSFRLVWHSASLVVVSRDM